MTTQESSQETLRDTLSFYIGILSIICWIFCIVPQFLINCISGIRSNLSPYLFIYWLIGDLLNLSGSILTKQLPFQIISCIFFVFMDILNISQYLYFSRQNYRIINNDIEQNIRDIRVNPALIITLLGPSSVNAISDLSSSENNDKIIGLVLGLIAGIMYILSRISQLKSIRSKKSTEGLLKSMFIFAMCGNITYISALLLKHSDRDSLINASPWIVCSSVVLVLDFIILCHF